MKIQIKILNKDFYCDYIGKDNEGEWEVKAEEYLPEYATAGSAALDLVCTEDVVIHPQERVKIHTGLAIWVGSELPQLSFSDLSVAALILPRSGLGSKGLVLANTIGLIDSDYQGELVVNVWNSSEKKYLAPTFHEKLGKTDKNDIILKAGERFAQLLFIPVLKAQWNVVEEFTNTTDRGTGGFGSTGG